MEKIVCNCFETEKPKKKSKKRRNRFVQKRESNNSKLSAGQQIVKGEDGKVRIKNNDDVFFNGMKGRTRTRKTH
jgi:DNA polymerase III delta prime subunit